MKTWWFLPTAPPQKSVLRCVWDLVVAGDADHTNIGVDVFQKARQKSGFFIAHRKRRNHYPALGYFFQTVKPKPPRAVSSISCHRCPPLLVPDKLNARRRRSPTAACSTSVLSPVRNRQPQLYQRPTRDRDAYPLDPAQILHEAA